VAARAGMSPRYLEYVERYPARPDAPSLRRLAAALQTTPAALLGAGSQAPPGCGSTADRYVYVRIVPDTITGRRIETH
jgi:transcriptional regulator with XRE-family HTH domain